MSAASSLLRRAFCAQITSSALRRALEVICAQNARRNRLLAALIAVIALAAVVLVLR